MNNKIIYYYQNFSSLDPIIKNKIENCYVYISSIHFGKNGDKPYIHINDDDPNNQGNLWQDAERVSKQGITIMVMLGGAGGAYGTLFSDFDIYYPLLYKLIKDYKFIKGIDLDVEEFTDIKNIKKLINKLNQDFGESFIITMAPVAYAMQTDESGMGGFVYKDLYQSPEGSRINWFNVQCYGCYNYNTFKNILDNGYPQEKIVLGMLGDEYTPSSFMVALNQITQFYSNYPNIGGFVLWEYGDTKVDPITWGCDILKIISVQNLNTPNLNCQ